MTNYSVGEAFSAGLGLAMGLIMSQSILQTIKPPMKVIRQVVVCPNCGSKNPIENKFCGQCGRSLYPPTPITCPSCGTPMPPHIKFCRRCGFPLKGKVKTKKRS
ncbi:MAG: zinc-ribbon domain-containing protein [Candidatus Bathyarchaeia archaeon]|nr:MAG: hypothetical protein C0195_01670 [Candidatus Bathyarchaeota archaeon]